MAKEELLAFFNKKAEEKEQKGSTFNFDPKIYFNPSNKQGAKETEYTVRILPPREGEDYFMERFYHKLKTNVYDFNLKKVVEKDINVNCLLKDCPLCKTGSELYSKGKELESQGDVTKSEILKKEAQKYFRKKAYVVRVIDRADEDYGVKFWSFDEYKNGGDVFDKIKKRAEKKGDFTDVENGYDFILTKRPNAQLDIDTDDKTPLSNDQKKIDIWLSETRTVKDIWKDKKNHKEYLEFIAMGIPCIFDKEKEQWVKFNENYSNRTNDDDDEEENVKTPVKNNEPIKKVEPLQLDIPENNDDDDDDLPF